jgi:hypothetical protein
MDININCVLGTTNTINITNNLIHCLSVFYNLHFILFYFIINTFMYISRHPFNVEFLFQFEYISKTFINSDEMWNVLTLCSVRCINNNYYIVIYGFI